MKDDELLDLLVVGAGPTGLAIGAEARRARCESNVPGRIFIENSRAHAPKIVSHLLRRLQEPVPV